MSQIPHGAWRMNVAAVIMDDAGNLLFGAPEPGKKRLHLPQGGVKEKESLTEALQRELREEVGLSRCRILAEYAGLRYTYRHSNEKSKRWLGQQQTYYLLHCPGTCPAVDCSGSVEFTTAQWLPLSAVTPELFVSFKREAAMQAITHFFPGLEPCSRGDILTRCTTQRYLYHPGQQLPSPLPTPLFAGKRDEALYHLAHLAPLRLHKKQRLLVILTGMEGCGFKKCLRHISHNLDPLSTRYHLHPEDYREAIPAPGELRFLLLRAEHPQQLRALEETLQADGSDGDVKILKVAMHLSREKQLSRLDATPPQPWETSCRRLTDFLDASATPATPWRLLPAEHGWYRDYLLLSLLRGATGAGEEN